MSDPNRLEVQTSPKQYFVVPALPGEMIRVRITNECVETLDGKALKEPVIEVLMDGHVQVPDEEHFFGTQGTGFMPAVADGECAYCFLHAANVDGVRCFVSANLTFKSLV